MKNESNETRKMTDAEIKVCETLSTLTDEQIINELKHRGYSGQIGKRIDFILSNDKYPPEDMPPTRNNKRQQIQQIQHILTNH